MLDLPSNVKQDFMKVVPASIASETVCFVFYDNHPSSVKTLDITLCTLRGEIIELQNRNIKSSLLLEHNLKPSKIIIHRTKLCRLHYIVQAEYQVFIIQSDNELRIVKKLDNIESFDIKDDGGSGEASLHLKCFDDAVPIVLDENFQIINDSADNGCCIDESSPLQIELRCKLNSIQYSVAHNESLLKEYTDLRYRIAFKNFEEMHNTANETVYKSDLNGVTDMLKLKLGRPWVKLYGQNIVIILDAFNENEWDLEDTQILLQTRNKMHNYHTKLFESSEKAPYWQEIQFKIKPNKRTSLVISMEMESLKENFEDNFKICGFILYKVSDREKMLPFETVKISTLNILRNELSLLSKELDKYDILAILATSTKINLIFSHIKQTTEDADIDFIDTLSRNLGLEPVVCKSRNLLVHRSSPYHVLHGLLILMNEDKLGLKTEAVVYFRTQSQILSFIHAIQDLVPYRIIITTSKLAIVSNNTTSLELYDEKREENNEIFNIEDYAKSLIKQLDIVKENYDKCIVKMNECKDEQVRALIGEKIDLKVCGLDIYKEFKLNFVSEGETGIKYLCNIVEKESFENTNSMFMDTDGY